MKKRIDQIISENVRRLYEANGLKSENELAKKSGVSQKTINFLFDADIVSNPTATVLERLAKHFGIKPWMLMIEDFPFSLVKTKPLNSFSGPTYVIADAMERVALPVQLLIMEACSHVLLSVDKKQSVSIKADQARYLSDNNSE